MPASVNPATSGARTVCMTGGANAMICGSALVMSMLATMAHSRNWKPARIVPHAPMRMMCRRARRRRRLRIAARLLTIVRQEDVLELRLGKHEVLHARVGQGAQQRIQVALDPEC